MDARTLHQKLRAGEAIHLIDVRSPEEFQSGHIEGAHLLPLFSLTQRVSELPKDRPVVVSCRSGARSMVACEQLAQMGYTEVFNLQGGVMAWQRAGLNLVRYH